MLRPWGGVLSLVTKNKTQTLLLRNEAQLNCVALRPPLDCEVAWRPVKGRDERQRTAPLPALHATGRSVVDLGEKNMEGRHVGLDFYDLLIEVESRRGAVTLASRWQLVRFSPGRRSPV